MEKYFYGVPVIAGALILYGVAFILIERRKKGRDARLERVYDISARDALGIGFFQALSLIPGTSRSGSTILGSRCIGISRSAAAEFSFFMGIPAMAGASLIKGYGFIDYVMETGVSVPALAWITLAVACVVAFAVSMVAIKFLMDFVKKHSFSPFGVYRIILGALVIIYFLAR